MGQNCRPRGTRRARRGPGVEATWPSRHCEGIEKSLRVPAPEEAERAAKPLPRSLGAALELLEATPEAKRWFGETLLDAYLKHKRSEIAVVEKLTPAELCQRYAQLY